MSFDGSPVASAQDERPPAPGEPEALSCLGCGYGIAGPRQVPTCPMCGGDAWGPARDGAPRRSWDTLD